MKTLGNQISRVRKGLSRAAILAVLALATVGLTQCRLVDSNVTGVELDPQGFDGRSACLRHCNEEFKDAMDKENDRHKAALRACEKIQNTRDRKACKKAEDQVHRANEDKIDDEKKACKAGCYNEGGGSGGR